MLLLYTVTLSLCLLLKLNDDDDDDDDDESYLSDIDNTVPLENTTPINQNKKSRNKRTQSRLIRLIGVVFSNGAMLSVSRQI